MHRGKGKKTLLHVVWAKRPFVRATVALINVGWNGVAASRAELEEEAMMLPRERALTSILGPGDGKIEEGCLLTLREGAPVPLGHPSVADAPFCIATRVDSGSGSRNDLVHVFRLAVTSERPTEITSDEFQRKLVLGFGARGGMERQGVAIYGDFMVICRGPIAA